MSQDDIFAVDQPRGDDAATTTGQPDGDLLAVPPAEAAKRIVRDWHASNEVMRPLLEQWRVNRARRQGYVGVKLIKQQNEQRAYFPLGAVPTADHLNKAARLCRRVRSVIFADPPKPEAVPSTGEDADVEAAEFTTRALEDICSEGNLDYALAAGDAFDAASDHGSGFIRFWTDPKGGGWRPRQIQAHPAAPTEDTALVDPATGQDAPVEALVPRYVREDGTLSDDPADPKIQRVWLPAIKRELLTGRHVRLLPSTCEDIWDASRVLVGAMVPLGSLLGDFPELAKLSEEERAKLVDQRPAGAKDLLPVGRKDTSNTGDPLERPVFVLTYYERANAQHPKGVYAVVVGDGTLVHRSTWFNDHDGEPMDIPLTQFLHFADEDNPYGRGQMEFLGAGNEQLTSLAGAMFTHIDRFTHRKQFLPLASNLTPEQLQSPTYTVLNIIPGGEPKYEDVPDFPVAVEKMYERLSAEMDDESGLQQVAQGVNTPSVQSGQHAQTIIEQVNQGLSDLRQHTERGLVRGWRIILQLIRRDFTIPQRIQWVGEDGAYKAREWSRADLGSTRDVRLKLGSFTQLAPSSKAALAQMYVQAGAISAEDYAEAVTSNIGGAVGLQDNPHRLRVRGQVSRWREGPPPDWQEPQPIIDPTTGQPTTPPDPVVSAIFAPRAVDDDPTVAKLRAYELGRALASQRYERFPPAWRAGLDQAYLHARQMAGIQTVAEQQAAAQAQAEAQQQAQQQASQQQEAASAKQAEAEASKMALDREKLGLEREKVAAAVRTAEVDAATKRDIALMEAEQKAAMMTPPPVPVAMEMQRDPNKGGRWVVIPHYDGVPS